MLDEKRLRTRILCALNASVLIPVLEMVACGDSGLSDVKCSNQKTAEVTCWAPHETHFNVGNVLPSTPVTTPAPIFDANGCQDVHQVADGCCNPAAAGPEFKNGQCCYAFCTGTCCGRPLIIDGAPRLAPVVSRSDWRSALVAGCTADVLRDAR